MERIVARSKELLAGPDGAKRIGFHTSGLLFLEEYHTLAVIGKAGIGTPHMDGTTRLCTASAAAALKESFGADGQPGSYADIDHADTIVLYGHNVAETQPVLWMRMLDPLEGPNPPRLVVVAPRPTVPARRADVHLAVRNGTNLALMNGLLRELIANDWVDHADVAAHTLGYDDLVATVQPFTPEYVAETCGIAADDLRRAARLIGTSRRLLSTVLQGFYQSHQATAAAVQVNNIHLVRGMLGRPGCGLLQMNGQPTSQNTRETGADGDHAGARNWANPDHVAELARIWNVAPSKIPHDKESTHAMEIFALAEQGQIRFLWIGATNPAVSLPDLARIRRILAKEELFLVVQDLFPTETTAYADVVLPAATRGEKTGTFTDADRTVHLAERAVDPPGEARPDLAIFLDYARRMDFRDKDGLPLITWSDPEGAFAARQRCSAGRPCDYTALSYGALRGGSGIPWPNAETERLDADGRFPTDAASCETYGHDLIIGKPVKREEFEAKNPARRAVIKAAPYQPPEELPDADFPLLLTTGRTLYHVHTRTKTARARQLDRAAPAMWIELAEADAQERGLREGDIARVTSRRGSIEAPVRITAVRPGVVFAPFHYGALDYGEPVSANEHPPRTANELTVTAIDPVSKQPLFKIAAVQVATVATGLGPAPAPTTTASAPPPSSDPAPTVGGPEAGASSRLEPAVASATAAEAR